MLIITPPAAPQKYLLKERCGGTSARLGTPRPWQGGPLIHASFPKSVHVSISHSLQPIDGSSRLEYCIHQINNFGHDWQCWNFPARRHVLSKFRRVGQGADGWGHHMSQRESARKPTCTGTSRQKLWERCKFHQWRYTSDLYGRSS